jgi:hypothetical protein
MLALALLTILNARLLGGVIAYEPILWESIFGLLGATGLAVALGFRQFRVASAFLPLMAAYLAARLGLAVEGHLLIVTAMLGTALWALRPSTTPFRPENRGGPPSGVAELLALVVAD